MSVTLIVFRQICVMALLIAVGFFLARRNIVTQQGNRQISTILTSIVIPAVVLNAFLTIEANPKSLRLLGTNVLLSGGSIGLAIGVSLLLFRSKNRETTPVNRACTSFTNNGFFGIPVLQALFGAMGAVYASMGVMCLNILIWTWGAAQFQHGKKIRAKDIFGQPVVLAAFLGLGLFLLRLWPASAQLADAAWFEQLRVPFTGALTSITALNTPLAMLVLGVNIAHADWKPLSSLVRTLPFVALRQILLPLCMLPILALLPVDRTLAFSVYVQAACPSALIASILALRFDAPPAEQARSTRIVVVSTVAALVTVPLMVGLGSLVLPV